MTSLPSRNREVMEKKVPGERISLYENCQFPRHRPKEVMQYLAYLSHVLLQRVVRAALETFQYVIIFPMDFLEITRAQSRNF